jgi:hypothetical protein
MKIKLFFKEKEIETNFKILKKSQLDYQLFDID